MSQTLLALLALSLGAFLIVGQKQDVGSHERSLLRAEVELSGAELADQTLDRLGLLPVATPSGSGAAPSPATLSTIRSVDEAHGLTQTAQMALQDGPGSFRIAVEVQRVEPSGSGFSDTTAPSDFRRVTVSVRGPLNGRAELERIYADR